MDDVDRQLREEMPFASLLGLEVVAASADEVRARLAWSANSAPRAASSTAAR
jgi:hypothetical protein